MRNFILLSQVNKLIAKNKRQEGRRNSQTTNPQMKPKRPTQPPPGGVVGFLNYIYAPIFDSEL